MRDKYLGRPSNDIDIATSATNAQVAGLVVQNCQPRCHERHRLATPAPATTPHRPPHPHPHPKIKRLFTRVIDLPRNTVKLSHGGELFEVATFRGYSRSDGLASAAMDAGVFVCASGWARVSLCVAACLRCRMKI